MAELLLLPAEATATRVIRDTTQAPAELYGQFRKGANLLLQQDGGSSAGIEKSSCSVVVCETYSECVELLMGGVVCGAAGISSCVLSSSILIQ